MASAKLSVEITAKRGITVHALMPVDIKEPADKAKNIVGKFEKKFQIAENSPKKNLFRLQRQRGAPHQREEATEHGLRRDGAKDEIFGRHGSRSHATARLRFQPQQLQHGQEEIRRNRFLRSGRFDCAK